MASQDQNVNAIIAIAPRQKTKTTPREQVPRGSANLLMVIIEQLVPITGSAPV